MLRHTPSHLDTDPVDFSRLVNVDYRPKLYCQHRVARLSQSATDDLDLLQCPRFQDRPRLQFARDLRIVLAMEPPANNELATTAVQSAIIAI